MQKQAAGRPRTAGNTTEGAAFVVNEVEPVRLQDKRPTVLFGAVKRPRYETTEAAARRVIRPDGDRVIFDPVQVEQQK